jgi:hypothetical protein
MRAAVQLHYRQMPQALWTDFGDVFGIRNDATSLEKLQKAARWAAKHPQLLSKLLAMLANLKRTMLRWFDPRSSLWYGRVSYFSKRAEGEPS